MAPKQKSEMAITPKEEACDALDNVITSMEKIWVNDETHTDEELNLADAIKEELVPIFKRLCG
jgi:hypothetical protein